MSDSDKVLALMVYETWLLNGATPESMPPLKVRKWCNRTLKRPMFSTEKPPAGGGGRREN